MLKLLLFFLAFALLPFNSFLQSVPSFVWARAGISVGVDNCENVAQDQNGFVYGVGHFDEDIVIGTDTFPVVSSGNSCGLITKWDSNGVYQWGMSLGNLGYPMKIYDVIISDQNEVYVSGRVVGTCYIGTNSQGVDTTLYSTGSFRSFIAKYTTDGVLVWTRLFEGTYQNWIWNLELDNSNNLVAVGDYNADIDFGNGHNLTAYHQLDCFVAWFDSNTGECINHFGYQGHLEERMYDIAFDSQGNYAIGGAFNDTLFIGNDTLISNGTGDAYISYYNSNGVLQWYDTFGGSQSSFINSDMVTNVEFTSNDQIIATGSYRDTLFFGSDSLISKGNLDAFIIKYDAQGQKLDYATLGGSSSGDAITGLVLDANDDLVMTITGNNITYQDSSYNFYQGLDVLVARMNSNLEMQWLKRGGSQYSDYSSDLTITPYGDVYISCSPGDSDPIVFDTISISPIGNNWYSYTIARLSLHPPRYANLNDFKTIDCAYTVYPNPSSDHIRLNGLSEPVEIQIADSKGRILMEEKIGQNQSINIAYLNSGLYYILIPEQKTSLKFIKE